MASKLVENVLPWVSTGLSAIGALFGGSQQTSMNKKMMEFNSSEAEKQRNWTESLWNKQNEYNTPANQMKLLREAGLSPVNFETSISPAGAVGDGFAAQSPQLTNPYLVGSNVASNMSRADLNQSQARLNESNRKTIDAMRDGQVELNGVLCKLNTSKTHLTDSEVDSIRLGMDKVVKEMNVLDAQIDSLRATTANVDQDTIRQAFENDHAVEVLAARLGAIESEIRKNNANCSLFFAEADNAHALAKYYLQQAANAVIEGKSLSWQYNFNRVNGHYELKLSRARADQATFDLDYDKKFKHSNFMWGAVSGAVNSFANTVQTAVLSYGVLRGLKTPKVQGSGFSMPNQGYNVSPSWPQQ